MNFFDKIAKFIKIYNFLFLSFFNDSKIENLQIQGSKTKKFFFIESLTEEKIGFYKIIATNQLGCDEASWQVAVDGNLEYK